MRDAERLGAGSRDNPETGMCQHAKPREAVHGAGRGILDSLSERWRFDDWTGRMEDRSGATGLPFDSNDTISAQPE